MSQRISLTRIVALNWYGFREIFDVDDNVLISGAFGTGKSALLDLIQYVMLGEHWRANRAAAGNARGRDLVGYCLGDTNQTRAGQRHFLRTSGVTLVALEYTRVPERARAEPVRETWGIRLEYSSADAQPRQTYFFLPDRLDYAQIAPDGKNLRSDDEFRTWLRRDYGNESIFPRQREYLDEMAAPRHLNFDLAAFRRTFPKAIAFEIEENVGRFIREFILEESPLDVRDVRSALRAYDEIRQRLEKQEDEAAFLRRIGEHHARCEASRREESIFQHTQRALKLLQAEEKRDRHAAEIKRLEDAYAEDQKQLAAANAESVNAKRQLEDIRFEIGKDPDAVKIAENQTRKKELQDKVTALQQVRQSTRQRLDELHYRWGNWLKHGAALTLAGLPEALVVDASLLARLHHGPETERLTALPPLAQRFNELAREAESLFLPLRQKINGAEERLRELARDLDNIKDGRMPGGFPLYQALRQKLGERVEQLGRLIEVKPEAERWWPALESFLGRNRWVLVVADERDYREALGLLRATPPGREPESLLHPLEVRQLRAVSGVESLWEKVEVTHPVARAYVEHLLGDVVCVESLEELEKIPAARAITPEGVFKQVPLRRRLRPAGEVELTLGREGLARMRASKVKEQADTRVQLDAAKRLRDDVLTWLDTGRKNGLGDAALPERAGELRQLPEWEAQLGTLRETIALLMTPERAARQEKADKLEKNHADGLGAIAVLNDRLSRFSLGIQPERDGLDQATKEVLRLGVEVAASRAELGRRFAGVLNAELTELRDRIRAENPKWSDCFEAAQASASEAGKAVIIARDARNHEREQLATVRDPVTGRLRHPEYQHEPLREDESNEAWGSRLGVLETVELKKSRELAADRKSEWERRLEENVLNELNRRIQDAQNTIGLLRRFLSQPIGKFRYQISQRRDTAGYAAIWSLLDSGLEPTDPLMAAVQATEIQRAKEELMRAVDAPDQGDERTRRLLDYRNYHHYDLEMVPADRPDAPPISLARSGRNLSGGENQAPFFISMLAAFRRVYDRGDRHSARSQQLGLVVMDEAFSKLSGDGIEDCLALARSFQLQLVMAFPPERLGVMVAHARTVVVCQKETERDAAGYVSSIRNVPLIMTTTEAVDALS
jgi:hypothetical protein